MFVNGQSKKSQINIFQATQASLVVRPEVRVETVTNIRPEARAKTIVNGPCLFLLRIGCC